VVTPLSSPARLALILLIFSLTGVNVLTSVQSLTTKTIRSSNKSTTTSHSSSPKTEVECGIGSRIPKSVCSESREESSSVDRVDFETRRMFVSLVAVGIGSSILGTNPETATAREPLSPAENFITGEAEVQSSSKVPSVEDMLLSASTLELSDAAAVDWNSIFQKASKRALGGGKAGASAAIIQVLSLMWLRTSMNRQYRYGGDLGSSLKVLWNEGGIPRLYQGLPFALVQGPLTRFGDTAANVGILALLESIPETQSLPLAVKTGLGSVSAGLWRIFLMPIDSSKTAMQVEGEDGFKELVALVKTEGPAPLYNGAVAQAAATAAGHFPWFLTYNYVDQTLPVVTAADDLLLSLARSAFLGLCASSVSDVTSNSLRVIKTTKQTARLGGVNAKENEGAGNETTAAATTSTKSDDEFSYAEIVKMIIEKDGLAGLFGRGLKTRLLTNALQGSLFSVLFKYFQQI